METKLIIVIIVSLWLAFGWWGFVIWRFEAHVKGLKMTFVNWLKLLGMMLLIGFAGWVLSFTPIKEYLIKED